MLSFAQYELIKPRERPAIWWVSTFLWYYITKRGCCEFQYCGYTHFPAISILSGQNHIIVQGCAACFLLIVNWAFKKVKILCEAMIGLENSFWLIYSNTHLRTRETLPLMAAVTALSRPSVPNPSRFWLILAKNNVDKNNIFYVPSVLLKYLNYVLGGGRSCTGT